MEDTCTTKIQIGIVLVNYNNSHLTRNAISSLYNNVLFKLIKIVIVDNNSTDKDKAQLSLINTTYKDVYVIYNNANSGYFSGLNLGIKYLKKSFKNIEHIVIGNNDLEFPKTFINQILNVLELFEKYPVISPDIVTFNNIHQNPHGIKKVSFFREVIYDLYYTNFLLSKIILLFATKTNFLFRRKDTLQYAIPQEIYQGYGACYILGPIFFKNFEELWAPTFLMGEEFFLSKQITEKDLSIYYEPKISVLHHDHSTVKKVNKKEFWRLARDSHKIYRKLKPLISIKDKQ